jgi:competence protein ComEC
MFATGLAVAAAWDAASPGIAALVGAGLAGALAVAAIRRPLVFVLLLSVAAAAAGRLAGGWALHRPLPPCHVSRHTGQEAVRLLADVADAPAATVSGEKQLLDALALRTGAGVIALCGRVEVHRRLGDPPLWPGERVLLRGKLRAMGSNRNPGVPSAWLRHRSEDVGAVMRVDEGQAVVVERPSSAPLLFRVRKRVTAALERSIRAPAGRAVVTALLLGDYSGMPPELTRAYARSGLTHLLAVSGLHLTFLAVGLLGLLRLALLRVTWLAQRMDVRFIAAPLAGVVAILYTLLTGSPPSAVRACLMACCSFLALMLGRPSDMVRPLSFAALALLAWDPLNLFRPSFQLSFAAVIALTLVMGRERAPRPASRFRRGLRWVRDMIMTTSAATLLTAPLVAHHFGQVSVAAVVTNLVGIPLTTFVLMPLAFAGGTLGAMHAALGQPLLALAGSSAGLLNGICQTVGACAVSAFHLQTGWVGALALLAAAVAILTRGWPRRVSVLLAVVLGVVAAGSLVRRAEPALEIVSLDVGQGDSTFVRWPDGFTLLVDGGGNLTGPYDPGAARVVPFLRAQGVTRLDLVVATHPHPDHVAGLSAVLRSLPVKELWVCWYEERDHWLDALLGEAVRRQVPVNRPRILERGAGRIVPLWPQGYSGQCADPGYDGNDNSIVLRVEYGRGAAVLAGDIEADAEGRLVAAHRSLLHAQVLKVPHHGSKTSSTEGLLQAVTPRLALISCGLENRFGFPAPSVLGRYAAHGITVARTDLVGAVGVRLTAAGEVSWEGLTSLVP